jgi:hypothetical protein
MRFFGGDYDRQGEKLGTARIAAPHSRCRVPVLSHCRAGLITTAHADPADLSAIAKHASEHTPPLLSSHHGIIAL